MFAAQMHNSRPISDPVQLEDCYFLQNFDQSRSSNDFASTPLSLAFHLNLQSLDQENEDSMLPLKNLLPFLQLL